MPEKKQRGDDKKFGMFAGVFTPTVLTILGAIMYLRTGWVVGNAGLGGAIAIVLLAHVSTILKNKMMVDVHCICFWDALHIGSQEFMHVFRPHNHYSCPATAK